MTEFSKPISIRWSDIDANFHLRHSVYYDLASQVRVDLLNHYGVTLSYMKQENFGPVILREECVFKREIKYEDSITIKIEMSKLSQNASRYTIVHQFLNTDNKIAALLTIDGAWIDTKLRKFKVLPQNIVELMLNTFPKTKDFQIMQ
jgi:acyl-CoA thioester hydrolase